MQNTIGHILMAGLVVCLVAGTGFAQSKSTVEFDKLKKLEGLWTGVKSDGKRVEVTYEVVSNGSALLETLSSAEEPSMISVYHMDGDDLMMTHYCSAGNQPRMKASVSGNGDIQFQHFDITNLKDQSAGHMRAMKVMFKDENHFTQIWTWSEKGKTMSDSFTYERKI